jgi:hypothetical protein
LYSNTKDTGSNQSGNQQQIPWKNSQAKVYLREELAKVDPSSHPFWISSPAEVWASEERFREYSKNNFCNNLRSYRKTIRVQMESIRFEDDATKQHLLHFASTSNKNNRGNPRLHNNPAKKLLELDVAAGRANGRKPAELKKDRPEYEQFETIQFCKAVNNERQKQRCEEFWAPKRNKEGALRNILRREKQLQDLGMIPE